MSQRMRPSEIRYIQDDVSRKFSDGRDILETFRDLVRGYATPDSLGPIEVVPYGGLYYAYDGNRRLLLYKKLESAGRISTIPVKIKQRTEAGVMMKYSTKNCGASVRVRSFPDVDGALNQILWQG